MKNLLIGEFIVSNDYGHCGVYVGVINGKRMVAESTYNTSYNKKSGVQLIDMDIPERKSMWKYHGKLWLWMDYKYKDASLYQNPVPTPSPVVDIAALKKMVDARVKAQKGDKNNYVKEIQKVLISKGFSCGNGGADGIFGNDTLAAVKKFQSAKKLTVTGIIDYDTIKNLID